MRNFLIDMFRFNQAANIKMVTFIEGIESNSEILKHLSHLVNCQYKWLERITLFPETSKLDWWSPVYDPQEMKDRFIDSTNLWIDYLNSLDDETLEMELPYNGYDGDIWQAKLKDIALQLIFHSFHHRAQMQMMIRDHGEIPEFIDYIGYKAHKKRANL